MSTAGRVTVVGGLSLPFSGAVAISRHCSYSGALEASERVGRQALALLTAYRVYGPLTDRQAANVLTAQLPEHVQASGKRIERTTITARRAELIRRGLVQAVDTVTGTCGVKNVRWGVSAANTVTR